MDLYWIGNSGSWNNSAHWAASSGGAGGAGVPTLADNVFFDVNSFTISGQIVTVPDAYSAHCHNFDANGALHAPQLQLTGTSFGSSIHIHGTTFLLTAMTFTYTGSLAPRGNAQLQFDNLSTVTINTTGSTIPFDIIFGSGSQGIQLASDIISDTVIAGEFSGLQIVDTGVYDLTAGWFQFQKTTLNANSSIFTSNGYTESGNFWGGFQFLDTVSTYNEINSIIKLNYNPTTLFNNQQSYDLELQTQSVGEVQFLGTSIAPNPYYIFGDLSTINIATISPSTFLTFLSATNITINQFTANGTSGNVITLRSDNPGTQYTITATTASVSFVDVQDCIAAGSTPFDDSIGGVDSGNNTNWTFAAPNIEILNVDYTTVQTGINVLDCGGQVTGVVYGPAPDPTIADTSITTASIVGPFFVDIPTLIIPGTTTYIRPYSLCSGVYKYYNQIVVTAPAISPILLATDNLIGIYQIEILDGLNNIICNLTGIASNLSFVISRNRPEEILFSVPLLVLEQLSKDIFTSIATILNTGINAVRIKRKNQILLAGQLDFWETNFDDPNRPMINIKAHGWLALLQQRIFSGEYTSHDANYIMRDMITQTQALTHGNYGITLGASAAGSNSYADKIFENKIISEAFIEFADEAAGVDFSFTWDKVFDIYWPRKGSQRQDILFTYPGNTESMSISSDSTKIVNNLLGRGQGNANSNINTIINDATSQTNYKLRSAVKDFPDIQSADQLVNITGSEVDFFKNPLILHSLKYSGSEPSCPEVGSYGIGDSMRAIVAFLDTFSGVSGGFYKLDKQTVQLTENGEEKVQLEFNNQPD